MSGAPYNGAVRTYYVPVGNATALYFGDPIQIVTNSSDGNGVQTAEIATAGGGTYVLGSFVGISNNAGSATIPVLQSQTPYLAASQAAYIYVSDDPFLLYAVQENGAMVSGASGRNVDLVAGAGSTVTSQSGWQLNSSTLNTTNTLQMRLIQLLQEPADNAVGTNAKWLTKINLHTFLNQTGV
jgi:hypothetical protein